MIDMAQLQILAHVAAAAVLGALVGLDRELENKPAGLRTHMLVAGAAALLVSISSIAVAQIEAQFPDSLIRTDPVRIMEAVVTGVSFLGAGTIIVRRNTAEGVEGLTTAASILFVTGIGVSVALSQWWLAIGSTLLVLVALRGVGFIADRILPKDNDKAEES